MSADLDFAETFNWKFFLPAGTLVETRSCCFIIIIFSYFQLSVKLLLNNSDTFSMLNPLKDNPQWSDVKAPLSVSGTVEDVAADGGWSQDTHGRQENRSQPFSFITTLTLSGTVSQAKCDHKHFVIWVPVDTLTHSHKLTNILYLCDFCQCHLIRLLQGPVLTPGPVRSAWQITLSTGRPQGGCYSSDEGGGDSPTHSQVTAAPFHSAEMVYFIIISDSPSSRARKQTLIWHVFIFLPFVWQRRSDLWCFDVHVFTFSIFRVFLVKHKEGPTSLKF